MRVISTSSWGGGVGLAGLTLLGKELRKMGKMVLFVYAGRAKDHLGMEGANNGSAKGV